MPEDLCLASFVLHISPSLLSGRVPPGLGSHQGVSNPSGAEAASELLSAGQQSEAKGRGCVSCSGSRQRVEAEGGGEMSRPEELDVCGE